MNRLRETSRDAYFKELDQPWDGMELDLHVAKAILFKHIARSGGSVRTKHRIENLFCRVKDYTRIVLRKDKTSRSYAGFVSLAFALFNIQLCP
jgi:hypothetical protein